MKLNQFYAIGNLVRDAEIVKMPNGKTKQVFSIAINDDYKKAGTEEWIQWVYFLSCYIVGKEYNNMVKGTRVLINGKLVTRNYEKDGAKKTITMVEVYALDFIKKEFIDSQVPANSTEEKSVEETDEEVPF